MLKLKLEISPVQSPSPAYQPKLRPLMSSLAGIGGLAIICSCLLSAPSIEPTLSAAELLARSLAFSRAQPLPLLPVATHERASALQAMQLPADQRVALDQSRMELVWLSLWDDRDEDGDTVEIESEGFSQQVRLTHAPIRFALPKPQGGVVLLRGIIDGGGGITVAALSGTVLLQLPVMAPGQVIPVSVR